MKKALFSLLLALATITAKAVTATVYVKADVAPFLDGWYTLNGRETKINGVWPGIQLTEKTTKVNKEGEEVEFWFQSFDFPETSSFNIIFNNGLDGVDKHQTGNISDIASDRYFIYDGEDSYNDITDDFGVEIPDVEIQALSLISPLNEWNSMTDPFTEVEKNKVYTFTLDLRDVELEQEYFTFKLMANHSAYLGYSCVTFDDPNEWLEEDLGTGNDNIGLILEETDVRCFLFTATFAGGKNIYDGWTLRVEEGTGDPGPGPDVKGDVNGDKVVDVADISAIISVMAGTATYPAADVNGDGSVDVADISNVISIMAD